MVKIPGPETFNQVRPASPVQQPSTVPVAQANQLGQTIAQIGGALQRRRQKASDAAYIGFFAEKADSAYRQVFDAHKGMADSGGESMLDMLPGALEKAEDELFKLAEEQGFRPSEEAKQRQKLQLASMRGRYLTDGASYENNVQVKKALEQPKRIARQASVDALNSPDKFRDRIADTLNALDAYEGIIPAEELQAERAGIAGAIAHAAAKGRINADPMAALDELEAGIYDEYLTADQKDQLLSSAATQARQFATKARSRATQLIRDEMASIQRTGERTTAISDQEILEIYPPEEASEILSGFATEQAFYRVRQQTQLTTPAEDAAILASITPEGEGFEAEAKRQDMLLETLREKYKRLGIGTVKPGDPVDYLVSTDPELQDGLQSEDPRVVQSTAQVLLDEQDRLGVPKSRRRITSNLQAKSMVANIMATSTEKRGEVIMALEATYGEHYDKVFSELVSAGLSGETQVLGMLAGDPIAMQQMAQVLAMEPADITKGLAGTDVSDLKSMVGDTLQEFQAAFTAGDFTGAAFSQMNTYLGAIEKLALINFRQSGDMTKAVEDATQTVLLGNYSVLDTRGDIKGSDIIAYMPKVVRGVAIDPAQVQGIVNEVHKRDLIEAFDPVPFGDPSINELQIDSQLIRSDATYGELGMLQTPDGKVSTEISVTVTLPDGRFANVPTLVKGQKDVSSLLRGEEPTDEQRGIAIVRAVERERNGATLKSYESLSEAVAAAKNRTEDEKLKPYSTGNFLSKERTLATAEKSGFWVTSEDGEGLVLMVPFSGGGALPLVNAKGEKYRLDFVEAMRRPQAINVRAKGATFDSPAIGAGAIQGR